MKIHTISLFAALAVLAAGCGPGEAPAAEAGDPAAAVAADEQMQHFAASWTANDPDAVAAMLADDVVFLDGGVTKNREETEATLRRDVTGTDAMDITSIHSAEMGDGSFQTGRWQITVGDNQVEGFHTFTFRREADGEWRIVGMHVEKPPEDEQAHR